MVSRVIGHSVEGSTQKWMVMNEMFLIGNHDFTSWPVSSQMNPFTTNLNLDIFGSLLSCLRIIFRRLMSLSFISYALGHCLSFFDVAAENTCIFLILLELRFENIWYLLRYLEPSFQKIFETKFSSFFAWTRDWCQRCLIRFHFISISQSFSWSKQTQIRASFIRD